MNRPITSLDSYRLLGRSGLRVSPLCLGTMTFGSEWGWGADEATSEAIFRAYAERGGNFIDTANFYTEGTSERIIGRCIANDRDRFVLSTKYTLNMRHGDPNAGGNHRKSLMQAVEASLKRLGTDYIDLYWVHAWEYRTPIEEVMRALDDLVRQGKVLYLGASDFPAWKVAEANTLAELMGWSRFIGLQVEYNLVQRDSERDLVPMAAELGLGVMPWSPLAGGLLTGKYTRNDIERQRHASESGELLAFGGQQRLLLPSERQLAIADAVREIAEELACAPAQVALGWLLTRPTVTCPIVGARYLAQLEDNLGALDVPFSDGQLARLDRLSRVELGFPHDFITSQFVNENVTGGARIPPQRVAVRAGS
ncbi:aldo/keto reductase [Billgrantia antri]|uniref:Aldo/keto reductase n=1 Tax=Halomonas sulfidivorans TaxID=2733488 RepID=A0ABX7WCG0_9GAMM|nr:aldo/keto reductase [Halomonas sulfidivorans]QTP57814.1 aldo/keto reductase [Halomonas sulfidivorans]